MKSKHLVSLAWALSIGVVLLAVLAWLDAGNSFTKLSAYSFFPLLGLTAFSLMWGHYIIGAKRRYFGLSKSDFKQYFKITAAVVLAAILLHPGLLILQLWRSGFGLPPNSYLEHYVAPSAKWAVMLGTFSLLIFLAFELHNKFGDKQWWKWVDRAQVVAMLAIFFHALKLGGELQIDWYRGIWYFYGLSLAVAVVYTFLYDKRSKQ